MHTTPIDLSNPPVTQEILEEGEGAQKVPVTTALPDATETLSDEPQELPELTLGGEEGVEGEMALEDDLEPSTGYNNPFASSGLSDPFARGPEDVDVPMTEGMALQAAEIYNIAGRGSMLQPLTPEMIREQARQPFGRDHAKLFLEEVDKYDEVARRDLVLTAMSDPKTNIEARIEMARALMQWRKNDLNRVQRHALVNESKDAYLEDPSPEARDDFITAQETIEAYPEDFATGLPKEEPARTEALNEFYTLLNNAHKENEATSGKHKTGHFIPMMIPFRIQYPITRILHDLGITATGSGKLGAVMMGEGLKQLREHFQGLDYNEKAKALRVVLKHLKPESGLLQDGNYWVTAHVLETVFQKELTGEDPFKYATKEEQKKYFHAIAQRDIARNRGEVVEANDWFMESRRLREQASGMMPGEEEVTGMQLIDNATTLIDAIPVASAGKHLIRTGWKSFDSFTSARAKVNPGRTAREAAEAVSDPVLLAKYGMTAEQIVENWFPAVQKLHQQGGVDGFNALLARMIDTREVLIRNSGRTNLSAVERSDAAKEIMDGILELGGQPRSTLRLDLGVMNATEEGVEISAVFGRSKYKPFTTLEAALADKRRAVEKVFGEGTPVEIKMMHPQTGHLVDVPKNLDPKARGQFYLQVDDFRPYDAARNLFQTIALEVKDISTSMLGSKWNWWRTDGGIFDAKILDNIAATQTRYHWHAAAVGALKDVQRLSIKQKRLLSKAIRDGEETVAGKGDGIVYTPGELKAKGLDADGVKAYYNERMVGDIASDIVNREVRTTLMRDGLKDIHGTTGRVGFAKPLGSAEDAVKQFDTARGKTALEVYDPATNTYLKMDTAALEAAYGSGQQVGRLKTVMVGKNGEATHVLINPKNGTKVMEVPFRPVPRVVGYYPHMWQGNFVVWGVTKGGNRTAIGIAQAENDARRAVEKLTSRKSSQYESFDYGFDRSMSDMGERAAKIADTYTNMGGPVYGARNGGKLQNFSSKDGDIMVEPLEAMMRGMELIGAHVTKNNLVRDMRQRLYRTARDNKLLKDETKMPMTADDFLPAGGVGHKGKEALEKSKMYLQKIDTINRLPDDVDQHISKAFEKVSAYLTDLIERGTPLNPVLKPLAKAAANRASKKTDPTALAMGAFHRIAIAANPIGQASLQTFQSLMALGISPRGYMAAVRQGAPLMHLMYMRALGLNDAALPGLGKLGATTKEIDDIIAVYAPVMGMKPTEVRKLLDVLSDSGFLDSTGHHTAMRAAMRATGEAIAREGGLGTGRAGVSRVLGNVVRGADELVFGIQSKAGFEGGENFNRVLSFLTLYNKDKRRGVANLLGKDHAKTLIGKATELTGSMIPEMSQAYQRGWLKANFQFVGFQHKMVMLMLPKVFGGSKRFTPAEKFGIGLAQFLLFGRRGLPHVDALYRSIETGILAIDDDAEREKMMADWKHPAVQAFMDGFVLDTGFNFVAQQIDPTLPDFAVSSRMAPGGGSELIVDRLWALSMDPMQAVFGMSGERGSEIYKFMNRASHVALLQAQGMDNVDLGDRINELQAKGRTLTFSTYNRYLTVMAAQAHDGYVSAGGSITEGFSGELEKAMFLHFGIMTKDRESLYDKKEKYQEKIRNDPFAKDLELKKLSNEYLQNLIFRVVKLDRESPSQEVFENLLDEWLKEQNLMFSMLPRDDAARVGELVHHKIGEMIKNPKSTERVLVERLSAGIRNNEFGSRGRSIRTDLMHAPFVKRNPALIELLNTSVEHALGTDDDFLDTEVEAR